MNAAQMRIVLICLSGWFVFCPTAKAKGLGFTDNRPYGTPTRQQTEKHFAMILPFGAGQFVQERYVAGSIFLLVEAGLLGASYWSYESGQSANRQEKNYIATTCPADTAQCSSGQLNRYKSAVRSADQVMVLLGFSALGTMIGGAAEAILYERKWSLDIGLARPPSMSPAQPTPILNPVPNPSHRPFDASLVLNLKRIF